MDGSFGHLFYEAVTTIVRFRSERLLPIYVVDGTILTARRYQRKG